MAFSKINYILLAVGCLIIILGFALMTGGSTTEEAFNPDIFSTRRIVTGPMVALGGFLFVIFAILFKGKRTSEPALRDAPKSAPKAKTASPADAPAADPLSKVLGA